jgi:hypothetical protein
VTLSAIAFCQRMHQGVIRDIEREKARSNSPREPVLEASSNQAEVSAMLQASSTGAVDVCALGSGGSCVVETQPASNAQSSQRP